MLFLVIKGASIFFNPVPSARRPDELVCKGCEREMLNI